MSRIESTSELFQAIEEGNTGLIERFLEQGGDPNTREGDKSLLFVAADTGNCAVVDRLIQHGARVGESVNLKMSPLAAAVVSGHQQIVRQLLAAGASVGDILYTGDYGISALWCACAHCDVETLQIVVPALARGGNFDAENDPLILAVVRAVCAGDDACLRRGAECVKLLIGGGARTDRRLENGDTLLHQAASYGLSDIVEELLDSGVGVDECDRNGATALSRAAWDVHGPWDRVGTCRHLLVFGADPNKADEDGFTPMHFAADSCDPSALAVLIEHGGNVNVRSSVGRTPLMMAAMHEGDASAVIEALVHHGANIDDTDEEGRTALACAAVAGRVPAWVELLRCGARADTVDIYGRTIRDLAIASGNAEVAELFR